MLFTESGIVTDVSPEQPENVPAPMLSTEPGILADFSPE